MFPKLKNFSISTQIVATTALIVLSSSLLIGYFSLHSSNEVLRRDAIMAIGSAADYRLQLLISKLAATKTRTRSILQMSDGICAEGSSSMETCLRGVFQHFTRTTEAAGVQFIPLVGEPINVGAEPSIFASIPLPTEKEVARLGRGTDQQVYVVVRATTPKGEIRAEFPAKQIQSIFTDRDGLGQSGEAFLTDASGYFLTATSYSGPIGHSEPIKATPIVRCLSGKAGESLGPDFLNVEKVHAFRPVEEIGGGCLMANIGETEAFAKSTKLVKNISEVIIITFLTAIALAYLASRWLTYPIRQLVLKAEALQADQFSKQKLVDGPKEIRSFDQAFLKMTNSLVSEIHERKQGQIELARAIKGRDEFLATLSHELRTPMNIIMGWIEILKTEGPTSLLFTKATETLERNAIIQKNLIDDLLDVSRIINGKFQMSKEPVDLSSIIRLTCEGLRPLAEQKNIRLHCAFTNERIQVSGDSTKLSQVVTNFVQNALKFTNSGGEITATLSVHAGTARFELRDTGIGIDAEFLPHVFDRLKQEGMGTTRVHSGLGLGLGICKHIVEAHDGKISVSSPGRNQGATFTVDVPVDQTIYETQIISLENRLLENRSSGYHVLIVDDSPDILFLLRAWLEHDGFMVSQADSAREGLKVFQEVQPDIILSDISMPIEDGYQFIAHIRNLPGEGRTVPAIALTAYASEEEKNKAVSSGFHMHVSKPTSKKIILQAVRSLMDATVAIEMK